MQIPWKTARCIICLREPQVDDSLSELTEAHIIPQSIGGELSARFLCKRCNSEMGRVEGQLPRDVAIIELVRALADQLPDDLVRGVLQHAGWFADTADYGHLEGSENRAGDFSLRESETIRRDENVRRQIRAELRRRDVPEDVVEDKVSEFEQAADGAELEITAGLIVTKHIEVSGVSFERTYDEPLAPRAIALGIAYTFLALMLEDRVYQDELGQARDVLRRVVARKAAADDRWPIEWLRTASGPEPKHALAVVREEEGALVRIWLFREFVWDVHFREVAVPAEPFYLLDVHTKEESIA
jgi:hypothetical protein